MDGREHKVIVAIIVVKDLLDNNAATQCDDIREGMKEYRELHDDFTVLIACFPGYQCMVGSPGKKCDFSALKTRNLRVITRMGDHLQ
ncbi:hypothetical protein EON65_40965 [archaeon]|nr:MAG: hypothetical protein EON65_40965 [archaeon]